MNIKNLSLIRIGFVFSILLYVCTIIFDWDLFEKLILLVKKMEKFEFDEILIPVLIFSVFTWLHFLKIRKTAQLEKEKTKIYLAMLSSSYHILNNFLNQMQIFKMTAEETPSFDPSILSHFDTISNEAKKLIESLSRINNIDEKSIKKSVGTKVD